MNQVEQKETKFTKDELIGYFVFLVDFCSHRVTGMPAKPMTIDEYLATVSDDKRPALEKLRKTIKSIVPKAEECISYGIAAFRLNGKPVIGFGASADHCTLFPMSGATVETLRDDLKDYETSKGAIRFSASKPLPVALVRKVIKTRIAEEAARNRK